MVSSDNFDRRAQSAMASEQQQQQEKQGEKQGEQGERGAATTSASPASSPASKGVMDYAVNNILEPALLPLIEQGLVPDRLVRAGMRRLLQSTLNQWGFDGDAEKRNEHVHGFVEDLRSRGIAEQTGAANEQHYEVPAAFFDIMMGPYLKYSSGYWPSPTTTLEESEEAMLALFCERGELASLEKGATVLDLGCGWGSLSLYAAKHFPKVNFMGVSNSASQREFILGRAKAMGLENVDIMTCDVNDLSFPEGIFDRVMSVEMMEHCKNYELLFQNLSGWMKPGAKMMVHIFVHKAMPYHFTEGWMSDRFFSGGTMPSKDLFLHFNKHLRVERTWSVNGTHYSRTLEAWLNRLDDKENKEKLLDIFRPLVGEKGDAAKVLQEWRLFCMACSELFNWDKGNEWFVQHYRFTKA